MPLSTYALNLMANELVNRTIEVRIHTGAPGTSGTDNVITEPDDNWPTVTAAGWSDAASGVVDNTADVSFGILDDTDELIITHYSLWDGTNFLGSGSLSSSATVGANEVFRINAGTIDLTGTSS